MAKIKEEERNLAIDNDMDESQCWAKEENTKVYIQCDSLYIKCKQKHK